MSNRHPNEKSALLYDQRAEPLRRIRQRQVIDGGHPDLSPLLGKTYRLRGQVLRTFSTGLEVWHDLAGIELHIDGVWQPVPWTAGLVSQNVRMSAFVESTATVTQNPGIPCGDKPCPVCFVAVDARTESIEGYTYQEELLKMSSQMGVRV